jgi:hypothetical protein
MCETCGGIGIVEPPEGRKVWEDCPACGGQPPAEVPVVSSFGAAPEYPEAPRSFF